MQSGKRIRSTVTFKKTETAIEISIGGMLRSALIKCRPEQQKLIQA